MSRLENGLFGGVVRNAQADLDFVTVLMRQTREGTCDPCSAQIRVGEAAANVSISAD